MLWDKNKHTMHVCVSLAEKDLCVHGTANTLKKRITQVRLSKIHNWVLEEMVVAQPWGTGTLS